MILASARTEIAHYLSTVLYLYTLLILSYIIVELFMELFAMLGLRPRSRLVTLVLEFLHNACEPYLRIFRRLLPSFGGWDLSPVLAILVLWLVKSVVVEGVIHG